MHDHKKANLEVWNCRGCKAVHISAGNVRLSLDREEFEAFTEAVVNIYCGEWFGEGYRISSSADERSEIVRTVLTSSGVH